MIRRLLKLLPALSLVLFLTLSGFEIASMRFVPTLSFCYAPGRVVDMSVYRWRVMIDHCIEPSQIIVHRGNTLVLGPNTLTQRGIRTDVDSIRTWDVAASQPDSDPAAIGLVGRRLFHPGANPAFATASINVGWPIGFSAVLLFWSVVRKGRRHPPGSCRKCGYDLWASKERCPECGTPIKSAAR